MKILLIAGVKTQRMITAAQGTFKNSIEVYGINYPDGIKQFLNRGDTFDRAIIFAPGYTRDGAKEGIDDVKQVISDFISEVQGRMPRYNLVICCSDKDLGLAMVEVTLNTGANTVIVYQETMKVSATLLTNLISTSMDGFSTKFELLTLNDLRRHQMEQVSVPSSNSDFDDFEYDPAAVDTVEPTSFGDDFDPFAEDSTGSMDDDPFADSFEDSGNSGNLESFGDDPFGSDKGDADPFGSDGSFDEEPTGFDALNTENNNKITPPAFIDSEEEDDSDPFSNDLESKENLFSENEEGFDENFDSTDPFEEGTPGISGQPSRNDFEVFGNDGGIEETDSPFEDTENAFDNAGSNDIDGSLFEEDDMSTNNQFSSEQEGSVSDDLFADEDTDNQFESSDTDDSFDGNFTEDVQPKKEAPIVENKRGFGGLLGRGNKGNKGNRGVAPTPEGNKEARTAVASTGIDMNRLNKLRERLEVYKRTGAIIAVTGGVGAGKTTVTANIANILCRMNYNVLVVDMDTCGRGQSYINFENYITIHSGDTNISGVKAALSSTSDKTGRFVNVINPGYHLLGTGLKVDKSYTNESLDASKISKFLHGCQNSYNFVIIDIPFDAATSKFSEVINQADHVVLVERMNNYGIMNFLLDMTNIEDEQLTDDMFDKSKVIFNMDDGCNSIFGKKVSSTSQVFAAMDIRLSELLGYKFDYSFANMNVVDIIKYNKNFEKYWFTKKFCSDVDGKKLFTELLMNIFEV